MAWTYGSKFGGGGSVSGTGTAGQVVIWTGSASIGGDTGLTFNVSTNALTASTFIGALTGNADTATNADQLDSHHGSYYQPAAAPLATLAALVDAAGWLHSSGANVFAWSTPTYSEVGALAAGGTAADSDKLDGQHGSYYATAGAAPTAHALVDTTGHTASGLTTGHFLKATAATTYAFGAHGLTYSDVGADAAGAAAAVTPTTLGLVIGTNTQAYSAKLGTFSALADAAGWLHSSGAGVYAWSTPTAGDVGALATAGTAADSDKLDGQHGSYYQTLLTNPVTGTGTTGKIPKLTGASTLGDSVITESGGTVDVAGNFAANIAMNPSFVAADFTVPSYYNAYSAGPLTIRENINVTLGDYANWSVL